MLNRGRFNQFKLNSIPGSAFVPATAFFSSATYKKRFYYKVYSPSLAYITTWSEDVINEPSFRSVINGGPGELVIDLARAFDNFGEGIDVSLQNRVELWVSDGITNIQRLYSGYISAYAPVLDGEKKFVEVTVLGYISEASYRIIKSGTSTTITYSDQDPSVILRSVIDSYRADGGINLNYGGSTIMNTGNMATYTFRYNTLKEAFDRILSMTPNNWFYYIDSNGNINLKNANVTAADHVLTIGKDIALLQTRKSVENLVNQVFVVGGGATPLFNKYARTSSQVAYGKYEKKIQDGQVTDNDTADLIAKRVLDYYQAPETRTVIRIVDNNGENQNQGLDIESFKVGDTIQIKNLNFGTTTTSNWDAAIWDIDVWEASLQYSTASILIIVSIDYNLNYIDIEASSRLPEVARYIEDVSGKADISLQQDLPTSPTERSV